MKNCELCPRRCGADRSKTQGFCGAGDRLKIALITNHFGEEPPLCPTKGSGAVFFSGCPLKCVFCQNAAISAGGKGEYYSTEALKERLLRLNDEADNINLITAGHYLNLLLPVLEEIKPKISVPIVYNSSGYERAEAIRRLDGLIDVYLPDYKYFSSQLAAKYSLCPDYPDIARAAIDEMVRQQGDTVIRDRRILSGVIIRHLVLPNCRQDSLSVLRDAAARWKGRFLLSLMSQYTPDFNRSDYPELNRRVTSFEYNSVVQEAVNLGLKGFMQQKDSATSAMTPDF